MYNLVALSPFTLLCSLHHYHPQNFFSTPNYCSCFYIIIIIIISNIAPWVHLLEECDGTPQRKAHSGTDCTTLLQLCKSYRILSHIILCIPPKEGLLEVGRGYNPYFIGEETEVWEICLAQHLSSWRVGIQSQVFSLHLCVCACLFHNIP